MLSFTTILIAINVIFSLMAFQNPSLQSRMMLNPYMVVQRKQYYRLITHAFIHGDFIHLFFNMYVLYGFGELLETIFTDQSVFNRLFPDTQFWGSNAGFFVFGILYFGSVLFSVLPSLKKHQNNPSYNSLGASGAVSGIVMACMLLLPTLPLQFIFIPIGIPAFIMGAAYLTYEYMMSKRGGTGIAHDAHFYGAIFALVLLLFLRPSFGLHFLSQVWAYISGWLG